MKYITIIKTITTLVAVILGIIHLSYPNIKLDSITLGLFMVAVLPWLAPIFKSVELPGGMKFLLQDFKEIEEKANKAGLIEEDKRSNDQTTYSFLMVANEDPKLALAGLRIELEDKLRKIALKNKLGMNYKGISHLMKVLSDNNLITNEERAVLADIAGILNAAVHSKLKEFEFTNVNWALNIGVKVLKSLDKKIDSKS